MDALEEILSDASRTAVPKVPSKVTPEYVRVRLEYDDKFIEDNVAVAYLARLQHHLENPSQLLS